MKKVFYIIIPILVLILVGEFAYVSVLDKKDTKNEVVDKDNSGNKDVEKEETLYHIYAHQDNIYKVNNQFEYYQDIYDFIITENYNILVAKKSFTSDELGHCDNYRGDNSCNWIAALEQLKSSKHVISLKLNGNQKEMLKEILANIEYTMELGTTNSFDNIHYNYYIENYSLKKVYKNDNDDSIDQLVYALMSETPLYFDYVKRDNNVNNYIKGKNYQELDIQSEFVKTLYSKVIYDVVSTSEYLSSDALKSSSQLLVDKFIGPIAEHYTHEALTNNSIITLALQQMEIDGLYENCDRPWQKCYFKQEYLDNYVKKIFGLNVSYNINEYKSEGGSFKYYSLDKKGLYVSYGTGGGSDEETIAQIAKAYQTDNKIVIVEKSMYLITGEECGGNTHQCNKGLYNNVKDKVLITKNVNNIYVDNNDLYQYTFNKLSEKFDFSKYEPFVTYYSYTFTKGEDGNYYYTDFARLN